MSAPRTDNLTDASPGQLYITASGHLYHAGKICIVMCGLPARGKTARTVSLDRYLRWLGVKTKKFHLGDYRRRILGPESVLPENYFSFEAESRDELMQTATDDIWEFFQNGGQVALYDAINPLAAERRRLNKLCHDHGAECIFVECSITDENMLARNIAEINRASPEYNTKNKEEAIKLHLRKLKQAFQFYEPVNEKELIYIKIQNDGEKFNVNHGPLGYLMNKVLLFNLNSRKRRGSIFFARAGDAGPDAEGEDDDLSSEGCAFARALFETTVKYMSTEDYVHHDHSGLDPDQLRAFADAESRAESPVEGVSSNSSSIPTKTDRNLVVMTSSRAKSVQTSQPFKQAGFPTFHYSLMTQRKEGSVPPNSDYFKSYNKDPYHTAYPRGESFQDVAIRLEPVILELERVETSVLIIAHESVLSVLYGYFKGLSTADIPRLRFPANKLVELSSTGYEHVLHEVDIPGASEDGRLLP